MNSRTFAVIAACLFLATRGSAQSFDYTLIDVPCSTEAPASCPNGVAVQTAINGINAAGDIVGTYTDGVKRQHGFLREGTQYFTIDVPGRLIGATGTLPTSANGINAAGDIVGTFTAPFNENAPFDSPAYCPAAHPAACVKGFLYSHGRFALVLFRDHPGAIPQRIMPGGDIYGCLHDNDTGMSMYGAVWSHSGDLTMMAGGGELSNPTMDVSMSMNNGATPGGKVIVGLWNDTRRHGFVVRDGVFESYDVPSASITLTAIWDINPRGQFVGTYVDATGRHGFLQNPDDSAPVQIDVPGQTGTIVSGINPEGVLVGSYSIGSRSHGFMAIPVPADRILAAQIEGGR
jgi:hypothetical protein